MCEVNLCGRHAITLYVRVLYGESQFLEAPDHGNLFGCGHPHAFGFSREVLYRVLLESGTWIAQGTYHYQNLPHTNSYLIRRLPSRSRTVSLQASCQYLPDSLSASLADLNCSMILSTCLCLACVSGLDFSCALSMMSNTLSICGHVMSGTLGAFLRIRDQ